MTLYIRATDAIIQYPYPLARLRLDYPNVSFASSPTPEDLALYNIYPVLATKQPEHDARNERPLEVDPELTPEGWRQAWTIRPATPEEQADYDAANRPGPDWTRFKATAIRSSALNGLMAQAYPVVPVAAGALAPALMLAERGDPTDFLAAWSAIRAAVAVPADVVEGFALVAASCNLPESFINTLRQTSA